METIHIPAEAVRIISTSSKGNQSKWRVSDQWVKQNTRGYEGQAEVLASLVLAHSTLTGKEINSSFSKQLALYTGPAFIKKQALLEALEQNTIEFGRAKQVLLSQLNDPNFTYLFIEGSETLD